MTKSRQILSCIEKKKCGEELCCDEISQFINSLVKGEIPDYQIAAWLMAVRLNGMSVDETIALTKAMAESGITFDLSEFPNTVDKHSTGGVGDKTTLVIAPLVAAAGIPIVKFSGRALDFTGGTLDKLESIPGFKTNLDPERIMRQVRDIGIVIAGASTEMVPADKILYAMRDVTSTVDSIPLIAASVMSKKIAGGAKNILLDVKFGDGAFMRELKDARALARLMVKIAKELGRNARAILSSMEQPLGMNIGNSLEVMEAIDTLKGRGPDDLLELSLVCASHMVALARGKTNIASIKKELMKYIADGKALEKFKAMVVGQSGDPRIIDDYGLLPHAKFRFSYHSHKKGYMRRFAAREAGILVRTLGGGRLKKEDIIDPAVGMRIFKKCGALVEAGEHICDVYYNNDEHRKLIDERLTNIIEIDETPPECKPLIRQII